MEKKLKYYYENNDYLMISPNSLNDFRSKLINKLKLEDRQILNIKNENGKTIENNEDYIQYINKTEIPIFYIEKGIYKKNKEYKIKMSDINIWEKYEKVQKHGVSSFECVYKGKNKEKGNYVIIKEIEKKN